MIQIGSQLNSVTAYLHKVEFLPVWGYCGSYTVGWTESLCLVSIYNDCLLLLCQQFVVHSLNIA